VADSKKTKRQLLDEIKELRRRINGVEAGPHNSTPSETEQALRHLLESSDHERQLIAYEIHDGIAQQVAAALMQLQSCEHLRKVAPAKAKRALQTAVETLRQAQSEARRLISGVRPPVLDSSGLVAALVHLVQDQRAAGGPRVEFRSDVAFNRLAPVLENAVYRIAQEALTNACKHSRSARVRVMLAQEGEEVRLEVRDWGVGFDPAAVPAGHFGLEGIRERARLLLGKATIDSRLGHGTTIGLVIPLRKE
jgi:signal transduction histidine kinase